MSVQPIGFVVIVAGFACLLFGVRFSVFALAAASLLGTAAALYLGASGQVQPGHLLLAFVALTVLCRRKGLTTALRALIDPQPGFWLTSAPFFGVAGAMLLPRILPARP